VSRNGKDPAAIFHLVCVEITPRGNTYLIFSCLFTLIRAKIRTAILDFPRSARVLNLPMLPKMSEIDLSNTSLILAAGNLAAVTHRRISFSNKEQLCAAYYSTYTRHHSPTHVVNKMTSAFANGLDILHIKSNILHALT